LRWLAVKEHFKVGKNKQKKNEAAEAKTSSSNKMSGKEFEKELAKLQVELVRLQTWVQANKARVIVVFEGRDTAGKGGVISRITERTNPRVFRHVALPAPSDRQKTQVYMQRYLAQFPAAGAEAPWYIIPADDKRRARLNLIRHLLDSIPYQKVGMDLPKIPKAQSRPKGATEGLGAGETISNHY
jgi:polyphosphate kinase 2 (PPK2 family)